MISPHGINSMENRNPVRSTYCSMKTPNRSVLTLLLEGCVRLWELRPRFGLVDSQRTPNIVVATSYCTTRNELTLASRRIQEVALAEARAHRAWLLFAPCEYPFPNAAEVERRHRMSRVPSDFSRVISADSMNNTVEEVKAIHAVVNHQPGLFVPKGGKLTILVVTGQMHSRSALLIWKHYFPDAAIYVRTIDHRFEYQPDHPVDLQTGPWKWLFANLARHFLLLTIGPERTGRFRHNARMQPSPVRTAAGFARGTLDSSVVFSEGALADDPALPRRNGDPATR